MTESGRKTEKKRASERERERERETKSEREKERGMRESESEREPESARVSERETAECSSPAIITTDFLYLLVKQWLPPTEKNKPDRETTKNIY